MGEVTGQVETEKQLRLAASVFENAQEGILVTDREGTILSVNRALCVMTGYDPEELRGQNPRSLKSGVHDDVFYKTLWDAILNQGSWQGEIWNRHKDGRVYPEWLTISAVRDCTGRILNFVAITRDLTERKRYEERIAHEATHDALTGLPNRRHFLESLQRHLALADRSGDLLGSSSWTWTASRASTTPWGTTWGTGFSAPWRRGCSTASALRTWWPGWEGTSSPSSCPSSTVGRT
jgi:PAS domain S-box-containing protein